MSRITAPQAPVDPVFMHQHPGLVPRGGLTRVRIRRGRPDLYTIFVGRQKLDVRYAGGIRKNDEARGRGRFGEITPRIV
jgi:hypothetical protein